MKHLAALVAILQLAAATASGPPTFSVPACPKTGSIHYAKSVPDGGDFPLTQVDMCYSDTAMEMTFIAYNETSFYYNASQGTDDPIYKGGEVMEALLVQGTEDPEIYLQIAVNPNNVLYQPYIYNPSRSRAAGAPFDRLFFQHPLSDGLQAHTVLDRKNHMWTSKVSIPLGVFDVYNGKGNGTHWRMNFFRTVTDKSMYPRQTLGGWSPPHEANVQITSSYGYVNFV